MAVKQLLTEQMVTLHVLDVVQCERVHAVDLMVPVIGEYCYAVFPNQGIRSPPGHARWSFGDSGKTADFQGHVGNIPSFI